MMSNKDVRFVHVRFNGLHLLPPIKQKVQKKGIESKRGIEL